MAYSLTFKNANGEQTVELGDVVTVGRTPDNNVVLEDQGVSRRHCRFFIAEDQGIYVEDLGSSNGVNVDGVLIQGPTAITEASQIAIGQTEARLVAPQARPRRTQSPGASVALARRRPPESAMRPSRRSAEGEGVRRSERRSSTGTSRKSAGKANLRPRLKCTEGPFVGEVFNLDKPRLVIGRSAPADIAIDDESISRKHAEILKVGSFINIRDLGSANGVFVNGEQISEVQLAAGDTIQLGVLTFVYSGPGEQSAVDEAQSKKKKKTLFIGLGVLVLLGGVVIAALSPEDAAPIPGNQAAVPISKVRSDDDSVDPVRLLGKCKSLTDVDSSYLNWDEAVKVCAKVLELDPSLTEARPLERLARKEIEFKKILADAKLKASTSQDDQAIELLVQIDATSTAFSEAMSMFKEISERVAKRSKTQCLTEYNARFYERAADLCKRYLEVTCNTEGEDSKIKSTFEKAARLAKKPTDFTCPDIYRPFGTRIVTDNSDVERAVQSRYKNKKVAQFVLDYIATGRPKKIADDLKRLRARQPTVYGVDVEDLVLKLEVIDGRYTSGQEGILRNDPQQAEGYWKDVFEAEGRILPSGIQSVLTKDMGSQLAKLYFQQGEEQMKKEHYGDAFKSYMKGRKYDMSNQEILRKIAWMEQKAQQMVLRDPDCETARLAADITNPKSGVHQRAKDALSKLGCP